MKENRSAALGFIFFTLLIDIIGLGIVIPVFPDLITSLAHCSLSDAPKYSAWLMFAFAGMQFLFSPVIGGLSDRFGRRPVLLISLLAFGLDYIAQAFAPTLFLLFITRIIAGMAGASFTTASSYIADVSPPEKRAQNFGMIGVAFGLGFMIGPAIGGILGDWGHHLAVSMSGTFAPQSLMYRTIDTRLPFLAAALLSLINFAYGYFVVPESLAIENRRKFDWKRANPIGSIFQLKKNPLIFSLTISIFLLYMAAQSVQSTWNYYTKIKFNWDDKTVGYSLAAVGLAIMAVQGGLIRIIIPKIGPKRSVYLGYFLYIIGLVLFAFAANTWMMFVFIIPYCLGGLAGPAIQGIISNQIPPDQQGEIQGGLTGIMSLTNIFGPLLMLNLLTYFSKANPIGIFPGAPFIMAAIFMILATILTMRALPKHI
ncbi:MAG TPA: TCR/Tet family MFS transporter [Bacteroidia bacterium]|nr:TCR/Tet family MFS transporter [Bacteroidia bacterium]